MQAKLLKIALNKGSKQAVYDLIDYMKTHIAEPKAEMTQKGYFWDSVFYDSEGEEEYLYIVIKSNDFSSIMIDDSELVETPFRKVYDDFKNASWAPQPYKDFEEIFCFNSALKFEAQ